ncbi:Alcohol-forming fatty acyl-CoA reductase [Bertholletia excelsa]
MELISILQFLENRTILVTGAAGFLAKIFVEKVLRVQPNVKKLYLLLRASDHKSASQRFDSEVIAKDLFRVLRDKLGSSLNSFLSEKVTSVAGDIALEDLGVKDRNLLEEMWRQVEIVVNLAATTNFDERYDVALHINTVGAKHVLNFSKKCDNIKLLLHVSTAYVSGEREGLIPEKACEMGQTLNGTPQLDIETEVKMVEERLNQLQAENAAQSEITMAMKDLGLQRAMKYGWPNTYVFTKAMGEMVLGQFKENLGLVIMRPTIVTSTFKEPFAGWVEGFRTIDSVIVGYGKRKITYFPGDPETVFDLIPADMVVNAMIVAMAAHANEPNYSWEMIYQVGSSTSHPLRFACLPDYSFRYFTNHPWIAKNGRPVKVSKLTVLNSMSSFQNYVTIRYLLPLKGLEVMDKAFCHYFQATYLNLRRKINSVIRLVELYRPYLFMKCVYDDMNTEKLRIAAKESGIETDVFYFDPKIINWEDYFMNTHLPGVVKYLF